MDLWKMSLTHQNQVVSDVKYAFIKPHVSLTGQHGAAINVKLRRITDAELVQKILSVGVTLSICCHSFFFVVAAAIRFCWSLPLPFVFFSSGPAATSAPAPGATTPTDPAPQPQLPFVFVLNNVEYKMIGMYGM